MTEAAAIEANREEELSALLVTTTGTFPPTMKSCSTGAHKVHHYFR